MLSKEETVFYGVVSMMLFMLGKYLISKSDGFKMLWGCLEVNSRTVTPNLLESGLQNEGITPPLLPLLSGALPFVAPLLEPIVGDVLGVVNQLSRPSTPTTGRTASPVPISLSPMPIRTSSPVSNRSVSPIPHRPLAPSQFYNNQPLYSPQATYPYPSGYYPPE